MSRVCAAAPVRPVAFTTTARQRPRATSTLLGACILALLALCGCSRSRGPPRTEWVIHGELRFYGADGHSAHPAPPRASFRLWFPYVTGDLYGAPGAGELVHPQLQADGRFTLDLNASLPDLLAELEPTHFTLSYLRIEPPQARIARLAPAALQANGIEPIGRTEWRDARSQAPLMLLYVDRPAHLFGETVVKGQHVRYEVRAPQAGYCWVAEQTSPQQRSYVSVPAPARVLLAVIDSGS